MLLDQVPLVYWLFLVLAFVIQSILRKSSTPSTVLPKVVSQDEPPRIDCRTPFVGHVVSYIRYGPEYIYRLWYGIENDRGADPVTPCSDTDKLNRKQSYHAIFTLKVFGRSVYVFADPEALQAAEKAHKSIINDRLFVEGTTRLFLWSKRQHDIALIHLNDPQADTPSLLKSVRPALRDSLRPGDNLDEIGIRYQKELGQRINELAFNGPQQINLWSWLRANMTLSAGLATFGSKHPFVNDPSLQADFWAIEKDNLKLILYPIPSLSVKKAYRARQRVLKAMSDYAAGSGISEASAFVKAYHQVLQQYNLTSEEIGSFDATVLTAFIGSLIPLGFWVVCFILSKPSLMTAIREEVDRCVVAPVIGEQCSSIDMDKMRAECPVLLSTVREAARNAMQAPLFRTVIEDTRVSIPSQGQTYLLKKGSMALIAVSAVHANERVWGEDSQGFNEERFLSRPDSDCERGKADADIARPLHLDAYSRSAYTPFASGVHLCPGRHYAQTVIMATAALFFATFDVKPVHGNRVVVPPMKPELGLGAGKPTEDVEVIVQKRKSADTLEWGFNL